MSNFRNVYLLGASSVEFENLDNKFSPSDIAKTAIQNCFASLGINQSQIDFLISASSTPDYNNPSLSQTLLGKFDSWHIGGLEIRQSAAGFGFALELASNFIQTQTYSSILLVCTDLLARMYNSSFNTQEIDQPLEDAKQISADGVFACLVCNEEFLQKNLSNYSGVKLKLVKSEIATSTKGAESFQTAFPSSSQSPERMTVENFKANQHLPKLSQDEFISNAEEVFAPPLNKFLTDNSVESLIVHSPVKDLLNSVGVKHGAVKSFDYVEKIGYMGSAGIGVSLLRYMKDQPLKSGNKILLSSIGSGLNWSFQILEAC